MPSRNPMTAPPSSATRRGSARPRPRTAKNAYTRSKDARAMRMIASRSGAEASRMGTRGERRSSKKVVVASVGLHAEPPDGPVSLDPRDDRVAARGEGDADDEGIEETEIPPLRAELVEHLRGPACPRALERKDVEPVQELRDSLEPIRIRPSPPVGAHEELEDVHLRRHTPFPRRLHRKEDPMRRFPLPEDIDEEGRIEEFHFHTFRRRSSWEAGRSTPRMAASISRNSASGMSAQSP